jgi:hypothetical protein
MGEERWVQCQVCGETHRVTIHSLSEDNLYTMAHCPYCLYTMIYCPHCRDETKHIWCGENETEIYCYYNLNVDPRFY